jgi:multicomponent Na+:H+ antiporter subunit D
MLILPLGVAWVSAVLLAPFDGKRAWVGWTAVAGLAATFAATLRLALAVLQSGPLFVFVGGWPPGVGITLRADELGVVFALFSNGVLLAALIHEVISGVHERIFPAIVLFMATGLTGLFLTGDAFNMYVFFEIAMTSAFVLASYGKRPRETRAALIFTIVNSLGSVLLLSGIAALYHVTGTLDMRAIAAWLGTVDPSASLLIATIIFVAFSLKIGLFPFHFWLPPVYRDTWPAVAAILSGAVANIGSYGLIRFGAEILPREQQIGGMALIVLGMVSILYGAIQAIAVRSASEALAYSSVSQAGYILVAIGIGGSAGFAAAVLYALINALNKTVLFLATGLRGPLVGAAFVIGALSVTGIPPAVGFFGKAAIFRIGITDTHPILVLLLFIGSALAFVYMFQIYQRNFWEQVSAGRASPVAARMLLIGLAGLVLAIGIWPEPLLGVSMQAALRLVGGLP